MSSYHELKQAARPDDNNDSAWADTDRVCRAVIAYGPVQFQGTTLHQEVIWHHLKSTLSDLICSNPPVESLY